MTAEANAYEAQRTLLYKMLEVGPKNEVENRAINILLTNIAKEDAKAKKPMDPYIVKYIVNPNDTNVLNNSKVLKISDAVRNYYVKTYNPIIEKVYKPIIEKVGGKTKKSKSVRKTRRVKKLNGRK